MCEDLITILIYVVIVCHLNTLLYMEIILYYLGDSGYCSFLFKDRFGRIASATCYNIIGIVDMLKQSGGKRMDTEEALIQEIRLLVE